MTCQHAQRDLSTLSRIYARRVVHFNGYAWAIQLHTLGYQDGSQGTLLQMTVRRECGCRVVSLSIDLDDVSHFKIFLPSAIHVAYALWREHRAKREVTLVSPEKQAGLLREVARVVNAAANEVGWLG